MIDILCAWAICSSSSLKSNDYALDNCGKKYITDISEMADTAQQLKGSGSVIISLCPYQYKTKCDEPMDRCNPK